MCCSSMEWCTVRCEMNWRPVEMKDFREREEGRLLVSQAV